jgi:hypothetical protein
VAGDRGQKAEAGPLCAGAEGPLTLMAGGLRVTKRFPVARGILGVCVPDSHGRHARAE